jgi:iron complex outermembrane receptor protein
MATSATGAAKFSSSVSALAVLTAVAAPTALPAVALAQAVDDDRSTVEEIVVTSQKRAEALDVQEIPSSISAFTGETLEEGDYKTIQELGQMVPGADFRETSTFPGIQRFWLRAVGVTFSVPNFDPAVGVYQDGVFIAQNVAANLDTFDMDSLEVLRGPQGTLFGRNTSVGAVVTRTRRPGNEFAARGDLTIGSFNRRDFNVSVEGPLVGDTLLGKLAVSTRQKDGFVERINGGGAPYGESKFDLARATLVYKPSDKFDLTLIGEHFTRGGDGAAAVSLGQSRDGTTDNPQAPGGRTATRGFWQTYGTESAQEPWDSFSDHTINKVIAEANWDLGHGILTSVTGYIDVEAFSGAQFDGLPASSPTRSITRLWIAQDQLSEELRYASNFSETFNFVAGLYYFTQNLDYGEQRAGLPTCTTPSTPACFYGFSTGGGSPGYDLLEHDSYAAFSEGTFTLADSISLTLGLRYTHESKDVKIGLVNSGSCDATLVPPFETSSKFSCTRGRAGGFDIQDGQDWSNWDWKGALQYQAADNVMTYVSYTRGHRSGGFSFRASRNELGPLGCPNCVATLAPFSGRPSFYEEEAVDQVEAGFRSELFDRRVRLNVTAYNQWWDGIQRNVQSGGPTSAVQRTSNVEDSHVRGIELEWSAIPTENFLTPGDRLQIDGSFGQAWSGYDSDYLVGSPPNFTNLRAQNFAAPHTTAFLAFIYEQPVAEGAFNWRLAGNYIGANWAEGIREATQINRYSPRTNVDFSLQYAPDGGQWYVRVFGTNLLNTKSYSARTLFATGVNAFGTANPDAPREWGLALGMRY